MYWITLTFLFSTGLIMLKITPLRTNNEFRINCDAEHCPNNMPYCTPVGCVFQCPNHTFMNGSNCVMHCGDMYIYNKTCVCTCPNTHHLVEERIKIISSQFQKYKFCRAVCSSQNFQLNGKCIRSCPDDQIFVENGRCLDKCSDTSQMHRNITFSGRLLGIECLSICNGKYPFQRNGNCVLICDEAEVVVDRKCSLECPKNKQNRLNLELCVALGNCEDSWPDQVYCSDSCPENFYSYNKTCIKRCPIDEGYIWNGTCVSVCPRTYPYKTWVYARRYSGYEKHIECTDKCLRKTDMLNLACVDYCKTGTMSYNNICVKKCPQNTYISDNDHSNEILCVPECAKYIHQGKCVDHCPKFSINKTCVDFCSGNYKFQYKSLCESDCPNNTCLKEDGINCTDECSFDPRENTLADICPTHTPYRRQDISRHICVSECKVNEVLDDKYNCINVTECKRAVLSHGRCQDKCPPGYLYLAYDHQNTDNTYSYNVDDLKDNPCVTIIRACFPTILAGLFTLIYGLWFCLFISTKQMQCLQRRKVQAIKEQAEVNKEPTEENVLETYEDTKDVRLIDVATEEQEATQNLSGEEFEDNEDMHIVEVIIEEQRTRHELSGETFEVSEDVRLNDLETEEPLMDRELSGETFDGIEEVRLTEVATNYV